MTTAATGAVEPVEPVDPGLFTALDPLTLAGSRCTVCATTTFPSQADCPRCARRTMEAVALPRAGVLWTWTMQSFEPRPPYVPPAGGFVPFAVGYVDLGDVIVEGRLTGAPEELRVGMPMRLVPVELLTGPDAPVLGYAFAPDGATGGASS